MATNEKKRFAFSDDGTRIRASQGHSVEVSLGYAPQSPPARLYHGTATRFVESIRQEGLLKQERHHVHLSADVDTATKVGQRHGKPAILIVNAEAMSAQGHQFFLSENGVWLTDHVPVEFIEFPNSSSEPEPGRVKKKSARSSMAEETVAICKAGGYTTGSGKKVVIEPALRSAVSSTVLLSPEMVSDLELRSGDSPLQIDTTDETTIAALRRLAKEPGGNLACLNFASAKNPGGGFLGGAEAQEESLAGSSGLYPCLLAAPEYYQRNRACRTTLYLDLAIWSPQVPFFRDDRGALLDEPVLASVITAPAPNAGAIAFHEPESIHEIEPTLRRRARFVLGIAAKYQVRRLVLGAWGCGVFRNDPRLVAQVFGELLRPPGEFASAFDQVVFAIYDRSADKAVLRMFSPLP